MAACSSPGFTENSICHLPVPSFIDHACQLMGLTPFWRMASKKHWPHLSVQKPVQLKLNRDRPPSAHMLPHCKSPRDGGFWGKASAVGASKVKMMLLKLIFIVTSVGSFSISRFVVLLLVVSDRGTCMSFYVLPCLPTLLLFLIFQHCSIHICPQAWYPFALPLSWNSIKL